MDCNFSTGVRSVSAGELGENDSTERRELLAKVSLSLFKEGPDRIHLCN